MMPTTLCTLRGLVSALLLVVCLLASSLGVLATGIDANRMALERKYTTAHSLGENYTFDSRDGWQTVNTSNLLYKYSSIPSGGGYSHGSGGNNLVSRAKGKGSHSKAKSTIKKVFSGKSMTERFSGLPSSLKKIVDTIKGIGKAEPVTITWYTGHDLLNPSCWSNPTWAPTDQSMAAALTLDGWTNKPRCFKFLELCKTAKKCVFVRVVDSCAGCAKGSKHVDLTQAAFSALEHLDTGMLSVQMREATDPDGWLEDLWGPKSKANE